MCKSSIQRKMKSKKCIVGRPGYILLDIVLACFLINFSNMARIACDRKRHAWNLRQYTTGFVNVRIRRPRVLLQAARGEWLLIETLVSNECCIGIVEHAEISASLGERAVYGHGWWGLPLLGRMDWSDPIWDLEDDYCLVWIRQSAFGNLQVGVYFIFFEYW